MQYSYVFVALLSATTVTALPLNINLGAYSPALVVGDGEISFGGAENAAKLVETLSGSTASTAGAATGITRASEAGTPTVITPAVTPVPSVAQLPTGAGIGRSANVEPRQNERRAEPASVEKRDLAGFTAALNFATGALTKGPTVELGTGEGGSGVGIITKPGSVTGGAARARRDLEEKAITEEEEDVEV
ncbi:hypothetical protein BGZ60DRAFT_533310 [Tricladium varicosporioides]|nr:hypothetical protein BGZ60DRAFT_533310 [Hymenoscyphus varicosporioides]